MAHLGYRGVTWLTCVAYRGGDDLGQRGPEQPAAEGLAPVSGRQATQVSHIDGTLKVNPRQDHSFADDPSVLHGRLVSTDLEVKAGSVLQLVKRQARWLAATGVAVVAAGAFLVWGPIGLGNGPLWLPTTSGGAWGWYDLRSQPVAYVLSIENHGHGAAIIDGVVVTGSPLFAPLVLQHALIGRSARWGCTTLGPFSGPGLATCVQPLLHHAAGDEIPAGTLLVVGKYDPTLVLELTGPRPGQCWDLTSVVVRYHIGIKHYVGTYPQADIISCGAGGKPPN